MRLFALLLALYLTCLSCMPCADEVAACVAQSQARISATPQSGLSGNALGDWCSPLCQCHCCPGAVLAPIKAVQLAFATPGQWPASPHHAPLLVPAPNQIAKAVWQPPRA